MSTRGRQRWAATVLALGALTTAACARPEAKAGETGVADAVERRGGLVAGWQRGADARGEIERATASILEQPLTMEDAVRVALLNNPDLQATYEALGIAEAEFWQAGLLPNPHLFASRRTPRSGGGTNYEFELTQDVLDILVRPLRRKVAAARLEQVKMRVAKEMLDLAAGTRAAFIALQAQYQVVEARRGAADATWVPAELARRMREAGNLSRLAEAQHAAFHAESRLALARAEEEVVARRESLNRLMGLWGESTDWTVAEGLPELPGAEAELADLEGEAVAQRLDLAAARAEAEAIAHAATMTRRWRWLGGLSFGFNSERETDGEYLRGPNLEVEVPLFDRGQARIAALEAEGRRADQRLRRLAIDIRSEVREAQARVLAARRTAEYYQATVLPLHDTIVNEMQLFVGGMLESPYEMFRMKAEQIAAEEEAVRALEAYWQARIGLEQAVGGRIGGERPADVTVRTTDGAFPAQDHELHQH
jgi:outer membrane protein, heavy metal efflux system